MTIPTATTVEGERGDRAGLEDERGAGFEAERGVSFEAMGRMGVEARDRAASAHGIEVALEGADGTVTVTLDSNLAKDLLVSLTRALGRAAYND